MSGFYLAGITDAQQSISAESPEQLHAFAGRINPNLRLWLVDQQGVKAWLDLTGSEDQANYNGGRFIKAALHVSCPDAVTPGKASEAFANVFRALARGDEEAMKRLTARFNWGRRGEGWTEPEPVTVTRVCRMGAGEGPVSDYQTIDIHVTRPGDVPQIVVHVPHELAAEPNNWKPDL